jgi:hypothetical protein
MKMRKFAIAGAISLLAIAGAAQAQDTCFGLSEGDCAVIAGATENTLAVATSFNQTWSIDFSVTGAPGSGPITFTATGSGPVVLDPTAAFPISFDQAVTAEFNDGTTAGGGTTQAIIKDGTLYVDQGAGNFGSINLNEALAQASESGTLPVNPSDLMGMGGDSAQMEQAMGLVNSLAPLAAIDGFLTYTRSGSDFTFVADITKLISDPNFQTTLTELSSAAGPDGQQLAMMGSILPMLLTEGTITVVQTVDEGANVVTGLDFNVDASIDGAMLDPNMTEPIVITLKFSVDLSDVNGSFSIEAPANATPINMGS